MTAYAIHRIFIIGFIILALANIVISLLTFVVKSQKYGVADLWQNPDGFAIGTAIIGIICLGIAFWFHKKAQQFNQK